MLGFFIALMTVLMVLDCVILVFLVLIQLPKKEAGAGLAFGAGATDALFGAGSGTVLTKITKYAAGLFFIFAIILSLLRTGYYNRHVKEFQQNLGQPLNPAPMAPPAPAATPKLLTSTGAAPSSAVLSNANLPRLSGTAAEAANIPAATSTNAPTTSPSSSTNNP